MNTPPIKLVFVGDPNAGKTYLIRRFRTGEFPSGDPPTVFDTDIHEMTVDTRPAVMQIYEAGGLFERMRPLSYPDADVVLIGFDIGYPNLLKNVVTDYHPEIRHYLPDVPIILVGLKSDLRHDVDRINDLKKEGSKPVSHEEGQEVADRIGAVKYIECSARTLQNVRAPFYAACKAVYLPKKGKSKKEVKAKK